MPELPEVEVVRRGLDRWVVGRHVADAEVLHPRAARRHVAGPSTCSRAWPAARSSPRAAAGSTSGSPLDGRDEALVGHLGMSGQLLVQPPDAPDETHLRARVRFADDGQELRFVDQRTFGGLALEPLVPDGLAGLVPASVAHIARDPLDPAFDEAAFVAALRRRRTGVKRALLDQTLVSGVGNIYADEALWRARLHWAAPTEELDSGPRPRPARARARGDERGAGAGRDGFDALYVDVNGESG